MKLKINRSILIYIAFGVILFALLMNLSRVMTTADHILSLLMPILLGLLFAFVLNVPVCGFEALLEKVSSKKSGGIKNEGLITQISLLLSIVCIAAVLVLAGFVAAPALSRSIGTIVPLIKEKAPSWVDMFSKYGIDASQQVDWLENLDVEGILKNSGGLLNNILKHTSSAVSAVSSGIFGFIIAIYIILSKKKLAPQFKKLFYANMSRARADRVLEICALTRTTYSKFLSGQFIEAVILGLLMFLVFTILRLPYAGVTALITGICAFIPYIGALVSCLVSVFLILLVNPAQALIALAAYMVTQFVENQFIYPRVVGGSVGLTPVWTLTAALIGGKLFGLPGIIFFIPLTAVLYTLIKADTEKKLEAKQMEAVNGEEEGLENRES